MMKGWFAFIQIFVSALFLGLPAYADSSGVQGPGSNPFVPAGSLNPEVTPWLDKDGKTAQGYQECGQNCMYHKANENLSLESRYIKNLVIEKTSGSSSSLSDEESLGVVKQLRSIRNSMGSNERNIRALQGDPDDVKVTFENKREENLKPADVPYVETSDALARDMARRAKSDKKFREAIHPSTDWNKKVEDIANANEPKLEDFPVFEQVPRDKSNPNGDKIWVQKYVNGKPKYDEVAFQREKAAFDSKYGANGSDRQKLIKSIADKKEDYVQSLKNLATRPVAPNGAAPSLASELAPTHTGDAASSPALHKKEAFKKARAEVVKAANTGMKKEAGKGLAISSGNSESLIPVTNEELSDAKLLRVNGITPGYNASVSVIDSDLLESDKGGKAIDLEFKKYLSTATAPGSEGVIADVGSSKSDRKVAGQNDSIEINKDAVKNPVVNPQATKP